MSAEEPTSPSAPPPLRLVLTATSGVANIGRTDLVPGPGQRAIDIAAEDADDRYAAFVTVADALAPGEEATYDEGAGTFGKRVRVKSQAEQDDDADRADRAGLMAQIDAAIAGWADATAAVRQSHILLCLRAIRALARYVVRRLG